MDYYFFIGLILGLFLGNFTYNFLTKVFTYERKDR